MNFPTMFRVKDGEFAGVVGQLIFMDQASVSLYDGRTYFTTPRDSVEPVEILDLSIPATGDLVEIVQSGYKEYDGMRLRVIYVDYSGVHMGMFMSTQNDDMLVLPRRSVIVIRKAGQC